MTDQVQGAESCPRGSSRSTTANLLVLGSLLIGLAALPLLLADIPPIFDYPNHLARAYILAHLDSVPAFAANFTPDSLLVPNVLSDLLLLVLEPLLGIEAAGKALLILLLVLMVTGTLALGAAAAGRLSIWPLLAVALVWNEVMVWGFLNYALGLGLLFWGLAGWIYFDQVSRKRQLVVGTVLGLLLLLAHMVAFGLFAVGIAVLELSGTWTRRSMGGVSAAHRLAVSACVFVPAFAFYLIGSPANDLPFDLQFDYTAWQKFSPFTRLLSTGNTVLDVVTLVVVCIAIVLLLASRRVRLHRSLGGLFVIYVFLVLTLPYSAMGSYFLDSRIAVPAVFVLVAGLMPARPTPRLALAFGTGLVLLVGARGTLMAHDWAEQGRSFAAVKRSLDQLPAGAILIPAEAASFELGDWFTTRRAKPAHEHTAAYATIHQNAVVVNIFARKGQNPLVFTPADEDLLILAQNPIARVETKDQLRMFVHRVDEVLDGAQATVVSTFPGIYIIVFNRTCEDWPRWVPVRAVACGSDHALMRLLSPEERGPGVEEIETVRSST